MTVEKNQTEAIGFPKVFTFNPKNQPIRVEVINEQPHFVAKDVCDALNLTDVSKTVDRLDDDEKLTRILFVSGQNRQMWLVNESGLYNLIFQSRKPEAKVFRKWVTSEVLPSLRQNGKYEMRPAHHINKFGQRVYDVKYNPENHKAFDDCTDLRHVAYNVISLNGFDVRTIRHDDVQWYHISDFMASIGIRREARDTANMLNKNRCMARKFFIFGLTMPAWFTTQTGMQLIMLRSKKVKTKKIFELKAKGGFA